MKGPKDWELVFTTFIKPITAVRSVGRMTAAKNAERGATSMDWVHDRRMRNIIAKGREFGIPMSARKIAEGRCVKTMVWILPILLAIEEASSIEAAAMMEVVKKREPRRPSSSWNFFLKYQVTQELSIVSSSKQIQKRKTYSGARPDANASNANKTQRLNTMTLLSALISGSQDLNFDFFGSMSSAPSPSRGAVSGSAAGTDFSSSSHFLLSAKARKNLIIPKTA